MKTEESLLIDFIDNTTTTSHLKVDKDLGGGFYLLRYSEAQIRQAAQDIKCSEDIIIELLRNSRDSNAKNIYVATSKFNELRHIVVIDDGIGIDKSHHSIVFKPYVTSKINNVIKDNFGVHGRGMALYSIKVNSLNANICYSKKNCGCALKVITDTKKLPEKSDQSSFPKININNNKIVITGPKNIIRTALEFALYAKDCVNVYIGTYGEIASALYWNNFNKLDPFKNDIDITTNLLSYQSNPSEFKQKCSMLGLEISTRTARRILNKELFYTDSILDKAAINLNNSKKSNTSHSKSKKCNKLSISNEDKTEFIDDIKKSFIKLANKYYLNQNPDIKLDTTLSDIKITISTNKEI